MKLKLLNLILILSISVLWITQPITKDKDISISQNNSIQNLQNNNSENGDLNIYFYPLGNYSEGDSYIITYKDIQILVDAGSKASSAQTIINRITDIKMKDKIWDYVIVTHADEDHIASFSTNIVDTNDAGIFQYFIKNKITIGTLIDFDFNNDSTVKFNVNKKDYFTSDVYNLYKAKRDSMIKNKQITRYFTTSQCCWSTREALDFINASDLDNKDYVAAKDNGATDTFKLDKNCTLKILYNYFYDHRISTRQFPNGLPKIGSGDRNIISTCFLIQFGTQKFLFTGDLEEYDSSKPTELNKIGYVPIYGESKLIEYNKDILKNITMYKAGHHGKKTSSSEEFIDHIKPEFVPITCVAGTSTKSSHIVTERTPSQIVLDNLIKYTDKIYPTTRATLDENNKINGAVDFYGKIKFTSNGLDTYVETTSEHISDSGISDGIYATPKSIFETEWFRKYRRARMNIIPLNALINEKNAYFGQCTLIKYGSYDIVVDCGTQANNLDDFKPGYSDIYINKLKKYIVDDTIECLIVTTPCPASYQQVIDVHHGGIIYKGIFSNFKVNNLIDYGIVPDPTEHSKTSNYKRYNELIRSLSDYNTNYYNGTHFVTTEARMSLNLPTDIQIDILKNTSYGKSNSNSLCFTIGYQGYNALFTGRIHDKAEQDLLKYNSLNNIVYYAVPDFGNDQSASIEMLTALKQSNNDYYAIVNTVPTEDFHSNANLSKDIIKRLNETCDNPYLIIDKTSEGFKNICRNKDDDFNFYIQEEFKTRENLNSGKKIEFSIEDKEYINILGFTEFFKNSN